MEKLKLNAAAVEELTDVELNGTNGGAFWIPAGLAVALLMSAIHNFKDIREGFADGYAGTPRY